MTGKQTKRLCGALGPLFLGVLVFSAPAIAQTCDLVGEEITRLRPPSFENYTQWDEIYGQDGMEKFSDLAVLADGSVIAGGAYTKDEEDHVYKPLLVHLNQKGDVLWEAREEEKSFKTISRLIQTRDGYAVLGEIGDTAKGDGIYVAFYGDDGKRKSQWPVYERGGNLDAKALLLSGDGKSLLIAAQFNPEGKTDGQYGVLYKYTLGGKRIWRHGYSPGSRSVFNNLQKAADGGYIVSGEVQIDTRMAGWLLRVDDSGAVMWQKTYARGSYSSFLSGQSLPDGSGIILTGTTRPGGGGRNSGWVMKVDVAGQVVWQRYYYSSGYDYFARDVIAYDDGRISVLTDAEPRTLSERGHLRLMTFTPRGYLLNVEEFSEGQSGHAYHLIMGPGRERVMAGYTQVKYAEAASVNDVPTSTFNGWIVSAPSLDPYEDPCLPKSYLP